MSKLEEVVENAPEKGKKSTTEKALGKSKEDTAMILIQTRKISSSDIIRKTSEVKIAITREPEKEFPEDELALNFKFNRTGLSQKEAEELLRTHGPNELPEKIIPKWYIYVSQLWQPMPIMIWIAAIVEIGILNYPDFAILMAIQFLNATIGYYEITKAGDAVAALKGKLQAKATVKRDGEWKTVPARELVPGDMVLLAAGSSVPADCRLNEGQIDVDQSALTGESMPVTVYQGDSCKMGSTVSRGEHEGTVEFTGGDTFLGKTAALLKQNSEHSNLQLTLMSIVMVLVALSSTLCLIVLIYLSVEEDFVDALSYAVVLMVASIPLAIEIVTTTTLALGSKELTQEGAIVTRLAAIEDLAGMSILCSDKTGTLTLNKMVIQDETPTYVPYMDQYKLLRYAAMAAKWKEPPRDALDTLVLGQVDMASLEQVQQLAYMPFDAVVKRTEGTVKEGELAFKTTKGAPHVLINLVRECAGQDEAVLKRVEQDVHSLGLRGVRCLAVAKTNEEGLWEMLGMLTFLDPPRPDTKKTIEDAAKYGVAVKMITGDHLLIARETARQLGMGGLIKAAQDLPLLDPVTKEKPAHLSRDYGDLCLAADGFAQVYPEHKYLIVECLREMGYKVGMTGDGVNDAPALKRADVGVAVFGCTDAARAAADIVLTREGLSTIVHGIFVSRKIFVRIRNYLLYRISASLQLLVFFFIAVFAFQPSNYQPSNWQTLPDFPDDHVWPSYFSMPVLMLMLITLLNDGTLIAIGYDYVVPRQDPEKWNMRALFLVSSVQALVSCIASLLLLYWMLDSWNPSGVFQGLGLGGLSYGQIITSIYLNVSVLSFLTLFSARTGANFWWTSQPSPILLCASGVALTTSTILACSWPASYPDGIYAVGLGYLKPYALAAYVWIYCLVCWFIQDCFKVTVYRLMIKYNWFHWNDTGKVVLPQSAIDYINANKGEEPSIQSSQNGKVLTVVH